MIVINVQLTLPPVSHSLHLLYMYMIYRQFKSKECCALIVVFLSLHSSLSLYIVDSGMCAYLCVCVFNTWWRVIGQCTRAISAASVSATVTESPETLPANSFPVRVLPYLMIREHVTRRWKPVQERTYRLIIRDQSPSFITHDLTVYDSCNLCVMAWTDVCVSWKKKKKGVEVSYGRRLFAPNS